MRWFYILESVQALASALMFCVVQLLMNQFTILYRYGILSFHKLNLNTELLLT